MRHAPDPDDSPRLGALPIGAGAVASALLAVGAQAGTRPLAVALIACGLAIAWGWPILLDLPRPSGSSLTLLVGVITVGVVEVLAPDAQGLRWLGTALAIGLMATFFHELLRPDGRPALTLSAAGGVFGLALLALGAFHLNSLVEFDGKVAVFAAGLGVTLGLVVDAVSVRFSRLGEWALPISLVVAALAGIVLSQVQDVAWNVPMITALTACGVAHAFRRVVGTLPRATEAPAAIALGVGSVLIVGIVPYAALWMLTR